MQTEIIELIEQAKKDELDQLQTMSFVLESLNDKYTLNPNDESMIRATVIDEMTTQKEMNIVQAIKYLVDHRYEITQKDCVYMLNDIDSDSPLEIYNEKEIIALAEQLKEEFSK